MTDDNKLIYTTNDPCGCLRMQKKFQSISICEKTNTMIYIYNYCTLQNVKPTKHLYIFPDMGTNDYEHFYICPIKEPARSFPPKHNKLFCPSCNTMSRNVQTRGYQWLCNSCHTERLITPSLDADIYAHTGPRHYICSGVTWQCFICRKTQLTFFNDCLKMNTRITCTYCN